MAWKLGDIIWGLFGPAEDTNDSSKDDFDKGINERYNDAMALDFDENLLPLIQDLVANTVDPLTAQSKFLTYIENQLGIDFQLYPSDEQRRRVLISTVNSLYNIKTTKPCLILMLKWLGFETVTIVEHFETYGLDSSITFDSPIRRFDNKCDPCGDYSIFLEGGGITVTNEIINQIESIIRFNEPIWANLRAVTYNGDLIINEIIDIYVDVNGDLIYNNDLDPTTTFALVDGDLIALGPNKDNYIVNPNGDMVFVSSSAFYFNNALKFINSESTYVSYANIPEYATGTDPVSISTWLKIEADIPLNNSEIISKKTGASSGYRVRHSAGKIIVETTNDLGETNIVETTNVVLTREDTWYNIVVIVNTDNANNYQIFVDSIPQLITVIQNLQNNANIESTQSIYLGRYDANYSEMVLDQTIISNTVYSAQNVIDLYNDGYGQNPNVAGISNMLLRSNFDEFGGIIIYENALGNNGVLNNPGTDNRVVH